MHEQDADTRGDFMSVKNHTNKQIPLYDAAITMQTSKLDKGIQANNHPPNHNALSKTGFGNQRQARVTY